METWEASLDRSLPPGRDELGSLPHAGRKELKEKVNEEKVNEEEWATAMADEMTSVFIDGWHDMRWNNPEEIDRRIEEVHANYLEFYRKRKRSE